MNTHTTFAFSGGWGKTGPAHSFPTLTSESINLVQRLGYLGGEKLCRPILSPPWQDKASTLCRWLSGWRKTQLVHSFPTLTSESINLNLVRIHIQHLIFRGWEKNWAGPFFPHPDYWNYQSWTEARLSGWRKSGPAHSFPTLTSKSINLTLSWICKQPLLFRGWGKTGPAHDKIKHQPCVDGSGWRKTQLVHSFPTLTSESINLTMSWMHI